MLPLLSKPRRLKLLVEVAKPFSPALKLIPRVFSSTSVRLRAPCSLMMACGITWIVCGVSSRGAVCLIDDGPLLWYARGCAPSTLSTPSSTGLPRAVSPCAANPSVVDEAAAMVMAEASKRRLSPRGVLSDVSMQFSITK